MEEGSQGAGKRMRKTYPPTSMCDAMKHGHQKTRRSTKRGCGCITTQGKGRKDYNEKIKVDIKRVMGETAAREEGEREKGELVIVSYARRGRKEKFKVGKHEWCILHDMSMDDGWRVGAVVLLTSSKFVDGQFAKGSERG